MPFGTPRHSRATNPVNPRPTVESKEIACRSQSGQQYKVSFISETLLIYSSYKIIKLCFIIYNFISNLSFLFQRLPRPFSVEAVIDLDSPEISPEKEPYRILFLREHPVVSGHDIPSLMQSCRSVIRKQLYENYQLPSGIKDLPIPELLKKYINLDID